MSDDPRPTRRGRRLLWLLPLLALAAALYLTRPRPNQLVPYTTPPLDDAGTRVSLLMPKGWVGSRVGFPDGSYAWGLYPPSAWPDFLLRWRLFRGEWAGLAILVRAATPADRSTDGRARLHKTRDGSMVWQIQRMEIQKGLFCLVGYTRADRHAFDETQATIIRSIRVIPGGGEAP